LTAVRRVDISLGGRSYVVACEPDEEPRLKQLVGFVDAKLREVAASAPGANEAQLLVLASLLLADQVFDLNAEATSAGALRTADARKEEQIVAAVGALTRRIEDIASRLDHT
jgi:cell division protein ZapA